MQKRYKNKRTVIGATQEKVLLLLAGGLTLGLTRSPRQYFRVVRAIEKEWEPINKRSLEQAIRLLYKSHLVTMKNNKDGSSTMVLNKNGKDWVIQNDIDDLRIKATPAWDGKWRIVMFDIPEKFKKVRESMRWKLKEIGFLEYQKSVFIFPYPAREKVEFLIEFYNCRKFVRQMLVTTIDNNRHLKKMFGLK